MKLIGVNATKIDQKFLHAYLTIEKVPLEALHLRERNSKNYIGNSKLLNEIKSEYAKFKESNVTLNQ